MYIVYSAHCVWCTLCIVYIVYSAHCIVYIVQINTVTVSGQFDYAISDVEELFQRRLVSDVLHSTFRNVLELHIEVNAKLISNI